MRNGLVFAMEDDTVVENTGTPEAAAEVEAGAAEVVQQTGEVEELQAAIEDAEEGAETLEKIEGVLEESAESGEGVNETAAEIAEVAVESICARLGIRTSKSFPAMEAFGSQNSRLSATKIALENIGEHIKRIWEAIKAAVKRLIEKVKSFFLGLIKNTGLLIKHLEALQERVKNVPDGATPSKNVLEIPSLAKAFSVNKKADLSTAKTILANSTKLFETAKKVSTASSEFSAAILKASESASTEGAYQSSRESLQKAIQAATEQLGSVARAQGGGVTVKETGITYYGPFAGTRVLALKNAVKKFGDEEVRDFSLSITTYDKIEAESITALKRDEIYGLLKDGLTLLDQLKAFEKTQKEVQKTADNVEASSAKAASAIGKVADKEEDTAKSRALRSIASDVNSLNQNIGAISVAIPAAIFAAGKAVGDYASASIANLKTAK